MSPAEPGPNRFLLPALTEPPFQSRPEERRDPNASSLDSARRRRPRPSCLLVTARAQSQTNSSAQQGSIDQDVDLLRKDVRSQKKQIIAANLKLTDTEAEKFWPIYDQYTADLVKINDAKYAAIKEYVRTTTPSRMTGQQRLTKQIIGVDESVAQLRQRYVPIVNKVLPGKKTALFFQLDRRLVMLIDIQLATQIPMVQP